MVKTPLPAQHGVALLAQLARAPVAGEVKTRLLPSLSAESAAALHARMVEHVCAMLCGCPGAGPELWVDGNIAHPLFRRCRELGVSAVHPQCEGDLGQRMGHIARRALVSHPAVILVGSDAPTMQRAYIGQALAALEEVDVVLGPALDGGYVLLGLKQYAAELFADIAWGSESVLEQTRERVAGLGRSCRLLSPLPDIDRPEDLRHLPESWAEWRNRASG